MNQPNEIDAIIDGQDPYAYVTMTQNYGYGHIEVRIRGAAPSKYSYRKSGVIRVTCQIGGESSYGQDAPYAIKHGFDSQDDCIGIAELEEATKLMRKIERHLAKVQETDGHAISYAEYAHRVMIGSGVKHMVSEPGNGWANGGRMADKSLYKVGGASRARLMELEANLIARFSRKAA